MRKCAISLIFVFWMNDDACGTGSAIVYIVRGGGGRGKAPCEGPARTMAKRAKTGVDNGDGSAKIPTNARA